MNNVDAQEFFFVFGLAPVICKHGCMKISEKYLKNKNPRYHLLK